MLWLVGSCQNKLSAELYHVTILQAQVQSLLKLLLKLTADQRLFFCSVLFDHGLKLGYYTQG